MIHARHSAVVVLALSAVGLLAPVGAQVQPGNLPAANGQPGYVDGEVLVHYKPGTTLADRQSAGLAAGATDVQALGASGARPVEVLSVAIPVADAIALLEQDDRVLIAEPNWIYRHQATSNDPRFLDGTLWGMYGDASTPANPFGSQASETWARGHTGSSTVYVAVIDEGIDFNHPDLAANIWTNPFDPVNGIDDDGNGRIDDIHGWDFFSNDSSVFDGADDDHGTHVAGTIGAVGGNGIGVAGVNWNVKLIAAKFLGPSGGSTSAAVAALDYIIDLKTRHGLNIVATSNSWGGGGYSQALHSAIIRAAKAGILFVAAAGNSNLNNDSSPHYPSNYNTSVGTATESAASYDAVISVASITSTGAKSGFSNFGATTVDLAAPGSAIWSTTPNNTYSSFSGTSMATPHVSGAVALYKSVFPSATASDIRTAILGAALPTPSMAGITVTGGRLNAGDIGLSVPAAFVKSNPVNGSSNQPLSLNLVWVPALGADAYEYCYDTSNNSTCDTGWISSGSTTSAAVSALGPATTYFWQVRARNDVGTTIADGGAWWSFATVDVPPAAPGGLTATPVSPTQINLGWTENASDETSVRVERSLDGMSWTEIASLAANTIAHGSTALTCNTLYHYRVRVHRSGDNQFSSYAGPQTATTQACPPPAAPSGLTANPVSPTQINLGWTENASDETSIRVERSLNGTSWTEIASLAANTIAHGSVALTCNTLYHYRVRVHRSGDNQFSAYAGPQTAMTHACPPPAAPSGLTATPVSATQINLAWTDNASDETSMRVERSLDGAGWTEITSLAASTIAHSSTPLTCNTLYHYRVRVHRSGDNQFSTYAGPQTATTHACPPTFGDFEGNLKGDLLLRNKATGQDIGWLMNGLTVSTSGFLPTIADTNWAIVARGDFNGDSRADVLLRNRVTGQNIGWLMNGLTVSASAFLPTIADTNWEIKGVGDFDGDRKADVILRNKVTGQNIGWLMNGLTVSLSAFLPTIADTNWEIVGVGDLDGDSKADVILRNKVTGQNIGWLMNGLTVSTSAFLPTIADTNWQINGVGDFDGDRKADVILRNKVTGQNIGWLMNGLTVSTSAFLPTIADTNWQIKGVGDFDGDRKADVILRNKVTGQNIGWLMNGLTVSTSAFLPTIADTNWEFVGQGQ